MVTVMLITDKDYELLNMLAAHPSKLHELKLLNTYKEPIYYDPDDKLSNIQLIDVMGDDAAIVAAARVSYGSGTRKVSQDEALLRYLINHQHTSPAEMVEIKFRIKCPIYVIRQLIRHRTANVNEESARYSVIEDEFQNTPPGAWRLQSTSNKQGSSGRFDEQDDIDKWIAKGLVFSERETRLYEDAYALYMDLLDAGVAREQARKVLPLCSYTSFYWKMDARNLFHFLKLRLDSHAQLEIRLLAEAIWKVIQDWLPVASKAVSDYQLNAVTFSNVDIAFINGEGVSALSKREEAELRVKASKLGIRIP
jgi:thymidylate synthase (FAD)